MATITQRTNKDGSTVYRIRVYAGTTADGKQQTHQTTFTKKTKKSPSANKKAGESLYGFTTSVLKPIDLLFWIIGICHKLPGKTTTVFMFILYLSSISIKLFFQSFHIYFPLSLYEVPHILAAPAPFLPVPSHISNRRLYTYS